MNEFVIIRPWWDKNLLWSYVSPDALLSQYAGTMRYDEIAHFIKTAKAGHFIPLDDSLLFRVQQ